MVLEFQRADRMGNALNRVGLAVGPVVHRVDAPFVAGAVVLRVQDAVHDRVAVQGKMMISGYASRLYDASPGRRPTVPDAPRTSARPCRPRPARPPASR